jgi:HAD superfamily hydrolase (TIGR01509 family)
MESRGCPKFLYFDLGKVLLDFDHGLACRQIEAETGVARELVRQIVFESGVELRYERGEISTREFYELFCREAGLLNLPDFERVLRATAAIFEVNHEVVPLVTQLHSAGHRLGVLSNTCEAHWQYVFDGRYSFLNRLFDVYALSYELKLLKPEPEIYLAAARLAGYEPGEILFVDDRPENVAAARAVGFDAVEFTTSRALAADLRARGVRFND